MSESRTFVESDALFDAILLFLLLIMMLVERVKIRKTFPRFLQKTPQQFLGSAFLAP